MDKVDEKSPLLEGSDGEQIIVTDKAFSTAVGATVTSAALYFLYYCCTARVGVTAVCVCGTLLFIKRTFLHGLSFLLGWHWVLPKFVGLTLEEVRLFYKPDPIPVDKWIAKYGERRIKIRDALQRKAAHIINLCLDSALYTFAIRTLHLQPQAILAISVLYVGVCSFGQGMTLYFASDMSDTTWFVLSACLFGPARIRDGHSRWKNLACVVLGTSWGLLLAKIIWFKIIVNLYAPSEAALLLQLLWLPLAVGDAMAEIVGSCFGCKHFEVTGVGEKNTKTIEGVVAMFASTLLSCLVAVFGAWHAGLLQSGSTMDWIAICHMIAVLTTAAETFSPRSSDNFTIPMSSAFVLYAAHFKLL